jgi:long-chain acyl-CoA synthetase
MFRARVDAAAAAPGLRAREAGAWRPLSWAAWATAAREIAAGLWARGVRAGDRVAVLGESSIAWAIADVALAGAGVISVPLSPASPPAELDFVVRDAGVRALFCEPGSAARVTTLAGIDVVAALGGSEDPSTHDLVGWDELREAGRRALASDAVLRDRWERASESLAPTDPLTIVYTPGTTGVPKGVVVSHGNAVFEASALGRAVAIGTADEQLLSLPLSHVFARHLLWGAIEHGVVTSLGSPATIERDLIEVAPTFFACVPELLDRLHDRMDAAMRAGIAGVAASAALDVGLRIARLRERGQEVPLALQLRHRVADRLVLAPLRARLGSRLRFVVCGGAALRPEIAAFFHAAGVLVLEGYGMTETSGAVCWNRPDRHRTGTVGPPLPGVDVRIADDGEVLVHGPNVMSGYLARPDDTAAAFLVDDAGDRWLRTGDVGEMQDGFLRLTDRKRDVIKTAAGKVVAPQKIETRLCAHEGIAHAIVLGENLARVVALVDIDEAAMMKIAARENLGCRTRADLVDHPRIRRIIGEWIDEVNAGIARHEQVAAFALLPEPLRGHTGELTTMGRIRRRAIAERHAGIVATLVAQLARRPPTAPHAVPSALGELDTRSA